MTALTPAELPPLDVLKPNAMRCAQR